jgi:hypothetical protein
MGGRTRNRRRGTLAAVAWAVGVSSTTFVLSGGTAQSATTVATLAAVADAYVDSSASSTNYGSANRVIVDGSPIRQTFIRFDLTNVSEPLQSARLRMHVSNVSEAASPSAGNVARVDDVGWIETAITYNNRPTTWGTNVASLGAVTRNTWVEIPVTAAVTVGSLVTLGIRSSNSDGAYLDGRTSSTPPQLIVTTGVSVPSGNAVDAACAGTLVSSTAGPVADTALNEVSGVDQGVVNPSLYWMHNDSGDSARVFAVNAAGITQRIYNITGASAVDWEDMAVGPGPQQSQSYLYLGDIGDNAMSRSQITVYRVPEPTVVAGTATSLAGVEALRLQYPDGAHNAEAMLIDPLNGDLVIIEKVSQGGPSRVYRAPGNLAGGSTTTMSLVTTLSLPVGSASRVTGGDVSADGSQIAVRTYGGVLLWNRSPGTTLWATLMTAPCNGPVPNEVQGEAIAFNADGRGYLTLSEGTKPALHFYTAV